MSKKKLLLILFSIGLNLLIFGLVWNRQFFGASSKEVRYVRGSIGGNDFNFEVADTPEKRAKGLAGKQRLNPGDGMIFVFSTPDLECFWMKDVTFNIDILWFDAAMQMVHSKTNVRPATYPESFCPPLPAKYVVELPAGTVKALNISRADTLTVKNL